MIAKLIVQTVVWFGLMGVLLFGAAGTLDWPGAWAYLIMMVAVSGVCGTLLARHDPGLLNERLSSPVQKDQPVVDKVVTSLLLLLILGWLAFMGLDVRFGWSSVPAWVQAAGAFAILLSVWIIYRTMRENSFAAPVVKIQKDRGQKVISTGPYSFVRHPMYFGTLFYFAGTSLLLGSWWGLVFALGIVAVLCVRIPFEERTLRAGLEGYDDYAARVRYRLIPYVW